MTIVPCNLCKSDDTDLFVVAKGYARDLPALYILVRCRKDGLVYLQPQPSLEEQAEFYSEEYSPYVSSEVLKKGFVFKTLKSFQGKIAPSRPYIPQITHEEKTVLDFGCGGGYRMTRLKASHPNWNIYGFDVASNTVNKDIIIGTIDDIHLQPLDEIYMGNVLEHLTTPLEDLIKLHAMLKPGGKIYIDVPNIDSYKSRFFKNHYSSLDVPRHLYHFTDKTLTLMIEKAGFEVVTLTKSGSVKSTIRSMCNVFGMHPEKLSAIGIFLLTRFQPKHWNDEELNLVARRK